MLCIPRVLAMPETAETAVYAEEEEGRHVVWEKER
jgi:hypothetical protein